MRNILLFLALSTTILFTSCEGEEGPPGPPGDTGGLFFAQVFEANLNFNFNNDFSGLVTFPNTIEVFESDVVLVYLLDGVENGNDIWTQLPRTYFPPQGTLVYNFDHTFLDVNIFLGGNFDLNTLDSQYTDNQIFRIAVVPSEFASANLSMKDLLQMTNIEDSEIERIK